VCIAFARSNEVQKSIPFFFDSRFGIFEALRRKVVSMRLKKKGQIFWVVAKKFQNRASTEVKQRSSSPQKNVALFFVFA